MSTALGEAEPVQEDQAPVQGPLLWIEWQIHTTEKMTFP